MKNGRVQDYDRLNHQFHDLLVEASNNPHLPQLVRQLQTPVLRFQFRALFDRKEMADSFNGHTRIIAAVLKGDEAKAEREMQRHIERARAFILALPDDLFGRD
jgi:DNA-binding GntR family transcriptional regulator